MPNGYAITMSDRARLVIGLLTVSQIPLTFGLTRFDAEVPTWFIVLLLVYYAGLLIFYLSDIRRNPRVPPERRRGWLWAIVCLGIVAEMVYYWKFIRDTDVWF